MLKEQQNHNVRRLQDCSRHPDYLSKREDASPGLDNTGATEDIRPGSQPFLSL